MADEEDARFEIRFGPTHVETEVLVAGKILRGVTRISVECDVDINKRPVAVIRM